MKKSSLTVFLLLLFFLVVASRQLIGPQWHQYLALGMFGFLTLMLLLRALFGTRQRSGRRVAWLTFFYFNLATSIATGSMISRDFREHMPQFILDARTVLVLVHQISASVLLISLVITMISLLLRPKRKTYRSVS
jgi:phosphoglycerol transferase MdoB-like AlkP superfamily enzyme